MELRILVYICGIYYSKVLEPYLKYWYVYSCEVGLSQVQSWRHDMYVAGPPKIRGSIVKVYALFMYKVI